jgi:hypothetical protein
MLGTVVLLTCMLCRTQCTRQRTRCTGGRVFASGASGALGSAPWCTGYIIGCTLACFHKLDFHWLCEPVGRPSSELWVEGAWSPGRGTSSQTGFAPMVEGGGTELVPGRQSSSRPYSSLGMDCMSGSTISRGQCILLMMRVGLNRRLHPYYCDPTSFTRLSCTVRRSEVAPGGRDIVLFAPSQLGYLV